MNRTGAITCLLLAACAWSSPVTAVQAEQPASVGGNTSFVNDVLPALTRLGCNQGACHGSSAGKGGFKLSLRGFAPELDHRAIVRGLAGRRIDLLRPESSLLLSKPLLAIPHQGGRRLTRDSQAYEILVGWLLAGAPEGPPDEPRPIELVASASRDILEPGEGATLQVIAVFADGSRRDVSAWSRYDTNDASVVAVDSMGAVSAVGPGKAAVSASYQHLVSAVDWTVPFSPPDNASPLADADYAALPPANYIDEHLIAQWKTLRLWPSPAADDATFLRRVHVDLTGTLPTGDEVREFLADATGDKRERAVERLLSSEAFVDCWVHRYSDVLRVSREWLGEKSMWTFHAWLRGSITRNVPWDQLVREMISGQGDSSLVGPANYYRLQKVFNEAELWPLSAAETTAQTFLGLRIQCARCHNHPLDRWTQADYYGMVSFFAQVDSKTTPQGTVVIFDRRATEIVHPRLGRSLPPKPLDGPAMVEAGTAEASTVEAGSVAPTTRREHLARWITSPENPYFARAAANRIWRYLMGRGLVEPVDDLRASNPPTNAALLDALAADLVAHQFDLKHLMRTIVQSRAYQLNAAPTPANRADGRFYSHYLPRQLSAEQLLDALGMITGEHEKFPGLPARYTALRLPDTRVESKFLDLFGRPLRRIASCECERVSEPNVGQALEMLNSEIVFARVTANGGLVDRLISEGATDTNLLDDIYLRALGRLPAPDEAQAILSQIPPPGTATQDMAVPQLRREFFEDVLWAVVNSKEFLFNH